MSQRWSLAALVVAPLLALGACDQIGQVWRDATGGGAEGPGPAPLQSVPLEARALAGSVQPQDQMAALLAPEPVLIAPGEILVGARVDEALADTASAMGLASNFVRALRAEGEGALDQLPQNLMEQVRARAEAEAGDAARQAARDLLGRLGVEGEINVRPGGVVTVSLATAGASPTSLRLSQQSGEAAAEEVPAAIEWNEADRCPRIVSQQQLENDIALATRCTIQRLEASRQFDYVEPNYIASSGFQRQPGEGAKTTPPPATQPAPGTATPAPTTSAPAPTTTVPAPELGGVPNDPLLALQWHYRPRGTGEGFSPGGAGFVSFWEARQVGSRAVRVAVVDTGLDLTHPEIAGSSNIAPGIDLIANVERGGDGDGVDADPQDAGDRCGAATENSFHGTHVAGTVGAATNDRVGVAGGAWQVTIVPVRVLGRCGGELADIVSGIRWAAGVAPAINAAGQQIQNRNPADIINLSLSLQARCPASMQAAIDAAVARNVVVVVAAGNKANQAALYAPANCNNVIVVGAGDGRGQLAFYSNFGPQVDILAPGGDTFADSDGDGRPDGVLSTRTTRQGCYDPLNQNSAQVCYYSFLQGTSMATPHVSAALALMAAQTGLRGRALEDALFSRALAPHPQNFGEIECARSRNATPIAEGSPTCARPSGRGALDLTPAATAVAPAATP